MIMKEELRLGNTSRSPALLLSDADPLNGLARVYLTNPKTRRRDPASEERARRLVACWNAMIGTSTEEVEALAAAAKLKHGGV